MTHELKILPEYFEEVATNKKTFEIRKNDRNYKVGDKLILKEWRPNDDQFIDPGYTGREVERWVSYILYDWQAGLKEGYCIMALKRSAPEKIQSVCTDCIKHGGDLECDRTHCYKGAKQQATITSSCVKWEIIPSVYHYCPNCGCQMGGEQSEID